MADYRKIVLATGNQGKIKELTSLLQPIHIEVIAQSQLHINDAEETGLTFIENAILKARHAARLSGLPALADDSGLSVDALNGRPGIHSARYAGTGSSRDNIEKLLQDMRDIPDNKRQAHFHCVLALLMSADDPAPIVCHGTWHGTILQTQRGTDGFGYDPVFYVAAEQKTAAELAPDIKNKLSHRGQALRALLKILADRA